MQKIRIVPCKSNKRGNMGFKVQIKKWYGWGTIFRSYHSIETALDYVEKLKKVMDLELIK